MGCRGENHALAGAPAVRVGADAARGRGGAQLVRGLAPKDSRLQVESPSAEIAERGHVVA